LHEDIEQNDVTILTSTPALLSYCALCKTVDNQDDRLHRQSGCHDPADDYRKQEIHDLIPSGADITPFEFAVFLLSRPV
jgi:hypothetical protein